MLAEQFDAFYRAMWGERWPELKRALLGEREICGRRSIWSQIDWPQSARPWNSVLPNCFELTSLPEEWRTTIPRDQAGLLGVYFMDPVAAYIGQALKVEPGQTVLDMCAAPGGKSLILIEGAGAGAEILLNEVSAARRERLVQVVRQYVPRDVREGVRVTGRDGGLFARSHPNYFDRVLVDAPCSGERHHLQSDAAMAHWSPTSSKKLAQRQYALLTAALECTKVGGLIMFATCSLSKFENDAVVERLLKKKKDRVEVVELPLDLGVPTDYGIQFLPDVGRGGPFYWSLLRRLGGPSIK